MTLFIVHFWEKRKDEKSTYVTNFLENRKGHECGTGIQQNQPPVRSLVISSTKTQSAVGIVGKVGPQGAVFQRRK